ncbi:DUF3052 domain-containing protein [Actinophytocola sp.]|uniref:DUF3052 domain-containing protein n=1 Tax=Actinophytocola sp. TaxID=1872138 RepID=UPI002ED39D55
MSDAGYSGTPLTKKVGVKPEHTVVLLHAPTGWTLPDLPPGVSIEDKLVDAPDIVIAFYRARDELAVDLPTVVERLTPTSAYWIAWPRKAGGHTSDITENLLRELVLPTGLVDVKVAALDQDWSGLKFLWRKNQRPKS